MMFTRLGVIASRIGILLAAACAAAVPCVAGAQTYTSIDVPGASETRAHGINEQGEIVGFYSVNGQPLRMACKEA